LHVRVFDTEVFATIGPNSGSGFGTWRVAVPVTGIVDSISSFDAKAGR
jgi:hypothetical protein